MFLRAVAETTASPARSGRRFGVGLIGTTEACDKAAAFERNQRGRRIMTAFLILWLAAQAVSVLAVLIFCASLGRTPRLARVPRVAVLVAVKGHNVQLDPFLALAVRPGLPRLPRHLRGGIGGRSGGRRDRAVAASGSVTASRWSSPGFRSTKGRRPRTCSRRCARLEPMTRSSSSPTPTSSPTATGSAISSRRWWRARPISSRASPGWSPPTAAPRPSSWHRSSPALSTFPRLPFLNAAWGGSTALYRARRSSHSTSRRPGAAR